MPLFAPERDVQFLQKNNADFFKVAFRPIPLYKRQKSGVDLNDLYLEVPEQDLLAGERYDVPGYVKLAPQQSEWNKFGINESRDLKVIFSKPYLDAGRLIDGVLVPFPKPERGDAVVVERETYVVADVQMAQYFGNSETFLSYIVFCVKWRPSSMRGRELAIIADTSPPPVTGDWRNNATIVEVEDF